MCIDIFAENRVITILVLFEQVWLTPRYRALGIEEVYDFVIRNDDSRPITELRFLYPHDATDLNDAAHLSASVLPVDEGDDSKYGWYFARPPLWADDSHSRLLLSIPKDPFEIRTPLAPHQLSCKRLLGTPTWPEPIRSDPKLLMALSGARKSLFYVPLAVALGPGETGILRLRLSPCWQQLGTSAAILSSPNPYGRWPYRFSWELRVDCARIIRYEAVRCLAEGKEVARIDKKHDLGGALGQMHDIVVGSGWGSRDTSVRIESHRLAVVAQGGVEVTERVRQPTVRPMGDIYAEYRSRHGRTASAPAFIWLTGSTCNEEADLVHTIERIRDKLRVKGPTASPEIVREIATRDYQEALFTLMGVLLKAKLLTSGAEGKVSWACPSDESPEYRSAIAEVRKMYDHPRIFFPLGSEAEHRLFHTYVNLHPFMINFVAKWECAHWLPRALHLLWNVMLFVLAALALVFAILSWR